MRDHDELIHAGSPRVVIVGAGHGGGTAAALLRQYGYKGPITLLGEEPIPPYHRPPLSKAWLKGEADAASLALRPLEFYAESGITFRPRERAASLNRNERTVTLSDGTHLNYDILILATGARAIQLPIRGRDLSGIVYLRSAEDAEKLKTQLGHGKKLAVVGGGYIGLEVAASGRALGAEVVVLERETRVLARVACQELSDFLTSYHRRQGVNFELGCSVTSFEGHDGHVTGVKLGDGRTVEADVVVVGVGAQPNDELAEQAGLECARGVVVDLDARSVSDQGIFAIGDVTHRPMPIYDRMFRMESVPNALEQAKLAASAITGRPRPPGERPWQWSDQYDLKLQTAGYAFDATEIVVRGDPAAAKFAIFHLNGELVQSVEAINAPQEFMVGKRLILSRQPVDKSKLGDLTTPMKDIAS
ncbi:NAD(P)/FAD-dependent oxidoreductase [Bradyrhizobium elkanii]|uniref:NAD(P)/FAD-dependent oxidoreductase n=1 Tax=Bradyrhizobium elkanii TaxID=29448 RepID=UPI00209D4061|nr:FAD-dependent oxidoreductase [Bradyrhizobium elkanii]MCP1968503.1 3-phenylpropionate/trans-cinnamate dioxygenase ferredoxin reductase subunit [Bradyrhizobium elkanii]MCS4109996.1 3-phenylpropionate/trans-cinnamate dioxygenase ferredoxin reductase subunit [Bradyrhizobium elkanii]